MPSFSTSKAVQGLLGAALALCANLPDAQASLSRLPDPVALELIDEVERADFATRGRQRILASLSGDPRISVRARVAEAAGRLSDEDAAFGNALLIRLSRDAAAPVSAAAARGLAHLLARAPAPRRASIESAWLGSRSARERFTLGTALAVATPHVLTDLVLEVLVADRDASVRWAGLHAAAAHLDRDPIGYTRLALGCVSDENRGVRAAARSLLRRASERGWALADRPALATRRADRQRFRRAFWLSSGHA